MMVPPNRFNLPGEPYHLDDPGSRQLWAFTRADELFLKLKTRSFMLGIRNRLAGRPNQLLSLDDALQGRKILSSHRRGVQTIPVGAIQGSQGRAQDFDPRFRPKKEHDRQRWITIATLHLMSEPLPPISVVQVGSSYFVTDGNHRVSVARALGQQTIEAEVTVLLTAEILPEAEAGFACRTFASSEAAC